MLQLIYVSTASQPIDSDMRMAILEVSRRNNARDAVTGLLYGDDGGFLQVLEGAFAAVEAAFGRIKRDPRHRELMVVSHREVEAREFGNWAMAWRPAESDLSAGGFLRLIGELTQTAAPEVRATIRRFVERRDSCWRCFSDAS